jgi:hypothetical protein
MHLQIAAPQTERDVVLDSDDEVEAVDMDGDVDMSSHGAYGGKNVFTPGQIVTNDSRWMRLVKQSDITELQVLTK